MFVYALCYEIDTDKLLVVWCTRSGPGWLVRRSLQGKASAHTISLCVRLAVLARYCALQRLLPTPPTLSHRCSSPTLRRSGQRLGAASPLNTALPRCQQEMLSLKSSLRQRYNPRPSCISQASTRPCASGGRRTGSGVGWASAKSSSEALRAG